MKKTAYAILFALALVSCNCCQADESSDLTTGPALDQSLFIDMDNADLTKGGFYMEEDQANSEEAGLAKCYFWCHRAPAVYFYRPRYYYYCWFSPVYRTSFRIIMYSVPVRARVAVAAPAVVAPAVATPAVATPAVATPAVATPVTATPAAATPVTAAPAAVASNSILTTNTNQPTPAAAPALSQAAVETPAAQVAQATPAPAEAPAQEAAEVAEAPVAAPANAGPTSAQAPLYEANATLNTVSQTEEKTEAEEEVAPELVSQAQPANTDSLNNEIDNRIKQEELVRNAENNSPQYQLARHSAIAKSSGRAARGAVIDKPIPAGTPLANLGLRTGDILTHIDGRPINSIYDLRQAKANSSVRFVRGNEILVSSRPMLQTATNEVAKSFGGANEESVNMRMVKGMAHKSLNLYEYYDKLAEMEKNAARNK